MTFFNFARFLPVFLLKKCPFFARFFIIFSPFEEIATLCLCFTPLTATTSVYLGGGLLTTSVTNSSNGLNFIKKRAKNGRFLSKKTGKKRAKLKNVMKKNGRFHPIIFVNQISKTCDEHFFVL